MYLSFFESFISQIRLSPRSSQAVGQCPFHEDKLSSFSFNIASGLWTCHAGCGIGNAITFARRLGVQPPRQANPDMGREDQKRVVSSNPGGGHQSLASPEVVPPSKVNKLARAVVARYVYKDEVGQPLFRVIRTDPKGFFQERFENNEWIPGLGDCRRVIYNLPEVLASNQTIFFVEGEKDAERLRALSLVATTSPMGANSWDAGFSSWFKGKRVAAIPDNDVPGRTHMARVAKDLQAAGAMVKIIDLPDVSEKGDVSDFMDLHDNRIEDLLALVRSARSYEPRARRSENPLTYFQSIGIVLPAGSSLLPTEFGAKAHQGYRDIVAHLDKLTDEGMTVLEKIDEAWDRVSTPGSYNKWLGLLRDLHVACQ